ncbi:DNA-binding protein H-NS [Hasllibacter halocynthiae]|uniref:DNA-binding protein H-NS n=1 Tax=Hasllibacter halocynthiae TaxID=595589 RepID=A0A2T0X1A7_9RHOB|nr:H-NS histone family protein [Hasllibacter halocynthiae]PRY92675.1 DNA-binding protein H-NS [Hasllibacter halocynthiae]
MTKKLEKMDLDELRAELKERKKAVGEVEKAIMQFADRKAAALRAEFEERARAEGVDPSSVFGSAKKRRVGGTAAKGEPKFRHPENPERTWTGKGRQPVWFKEHVEKGGKPEDLAI